MKNILRSIFSEPGEGGGWSFGRCCSGFFAIAAVVWISFHLLRFHALPERLIDLGVLVASPYGVNKVPTKLSELVAAIKGKSE